MKFKTLQCVTILCRLCHTGDIMQKAMHSLQKPQKANEYGKFSNTIHQLDMHIKIEYAQV